jgi:ribosome-binding factor A
MVSEMRTKRIADRIREELSEMLIYEISDPRLSGISITDVIVDRELAYANIYVSALEGGARSQEILEGLYHAQGFLRRQLAHRIDLRTFPRLRFHWDPTFERAERIEKMIDSLNTSEMIPDEETSPSGNGDGSSADESMDIV